MTGAPRNGSPIHGGRQLFVVHQKPALSVRNVSTDFAGMDNACAPRLELVTNGSLKGVILSNRNDDISRVEITINLIILYLSIDNKFIKIKNL